MNIHYLYYSIRLERVVVQCSLARTWEEAQTPLGFLNSLCCKARGSEDSDVVERANALIDSIQIAKKHRDATSIANLESMVKNYARVIAEHTEKENGSREKCFEEALDALRKWFQFLSKELQDDIRSEFGELIFFEDESLSTKLAAIRKDEVNKLIDYLVRLESRYPEIIKFPTLSIVLSSEYLEYYS